MLHINNLHANVGDKPILKGLTLTVNAGEIPALRAFAPSREPITQLCRPRTLGICLTRRREAAKKGISLEGSVG